MLEDEKGFKKLTDCLNDTTPETPESGIEPYPLEEYEPVEPPEIVQDFGEIEPDMPVHEAGHVPDGNEGQQNNPSNQERNATFDKLLKNYDKATKIPPPEKIGIFVRKYVNLLAGQAGVGKSWQVIRWARDLSTGGECFGGVVENEPARKVLIIAGELPKLEAERRCRLLQEGDGRERNFDNFSIVDVKEAEANGFPLMLDNETGQKNIESLIAYLKPDIVFFDSFVSLFAGDEKDSKDVNEAMQFLERIAEQYSIAAVIIHHIRKRLARDQGIPINLDDIIGSSVFSRRSGFMFATAKVDYSPDGFNSKKIVLVKEVKSWLEPTKAYAFVVKSGFYGQGVIMDITPRIEDEDVAKLEGIHKLKTEQKKVAPDWETLILTFLKGRAEGATPKEINEAIGRKASESNKTGTQLGRLKDEGKVIQPKYGVYKLPDNTGAEPEDEYQSKETQAEIDYDNDEELRE